jgi:exoribonuclease II
VIDPKTLPTVEERMHQIDLTEAREAERLAGREVRKYVYVPQHDDEAMAKAASALSIYDTYRARVDELENQ